MTVEELAKDLLNAMTETFQASERAGLSAHDAWDKAMVRLKARCRWLAKTHPDELVARAMDRVNTVFKEGRGVVPLVKELRAAMGEAYASARAAGLDHEQATEKALAMLEEEAVRLAQEHNWKLVEKAIAVAMAEMKEEVKKGEKP